MKKVIAFLLVTLCVQFSICDITLSSAASAKPHVSAKSAILYDPVSNEVIYAKNIHVRRPVASLAKIMTAIVVLDALSPNERVRVSSRASNSQPSKVYLVAGESYTVRDLLYALLLNSGNDAAVCLAEAVAGSEWAFAQKMNDKAWRMGLRNTKYCNASGLPGEGQYSTAYDQARIMKEAMRYPFIRQAVAKKTHTITRSNGNKIRLRNHNKLLWRYSNQLVVGKTGFTRAARRCFLGHATYGNNKVIICVLNTHERWIDEYKLLDYRFGQAKKKSKTSKAIDINQKIHGKTGTIKIQRALYNAGYDPGGVDGIFGSKTLDAVLQFQRTFGLKVDGIVGKQTLVKLKQAK
jgi:D-alanyl-D-alanine carboxypeptidase (penicillin-binding protein 5/6)